ncbi:MAG: hypothetical protein A2729_02980 [Candidatus Buchananbacteria bacterium RIFCSPHIGHO2_01_FULL_39_14]|uniref:Uncharacterized protein n=2 Tax=Candidatus Buchananiibacteriota TaxID=1817903 RepID=A0A1G1YV67_9BACT|nr:MAG: hypothetical protein A2729_02980 [Candidatus Buchananbacteria bacterium RIFCSPHIGHO2_01_FULL_39_14]OGY55666.1 MAG: hypothetical protein A2912_05670 [Candidatus Buchananbacteria bacterium RIFCSPLOWO2_01_FULL_40_23b]
MPNNSPKGEIVKVKFPVVVDSGRCPTCDADVNQYIRAAEKGEIALPTCCPHCGQPFAEGIKKRVWRCGKCNGVVLNFGEQRYCTHCRGELVYPKEAGYEELLAKMEKESAQATKEVK